jgi:hypothetical protein
MTKLRDLIKDGMTDEQKADLLPHPKDGAVTMTEAIADRIDAPQVIKDKVKGT